MWRSGNLTIRLGTRSDLPDISAMLEDEEVARWLWFGPNSPEMTEAFFGPFLDGQQDDPEPANAVFIVEEDGKFVGQAAVVQVAMSPDGYEIGYQFVKTAWGRGLGKRVARFLTAYAVSVKRAYRIQADCLAGNAGSVAILKGLGLKQEGLKRGFRLMRGERHDELTFGASVSRISTGMQSVSWARAIWNRF